jgi:hypothetical protein
VKEDPAVAPGEPDPAEGAFDAAHRAVDRLYCDYSDKELYFQAARDLAAGQT